MAEELLHFNGINGASGDYLLPPMSPHDVSKIPQGETPDKAHHQELKHWYQRVTAETVGPKEGVDPKDLAQAGWGVFFTTSDFTPDARDASLRKGAVPVILLNGESIVNLMADKGLGVDRVSLYRYYERPTDFTESDEA